MFCIFLLNQSKNNAVLEPRAGHFRGLVGSEANTKAKDLSFEANAENFKMCLGGQGRPSRTQSLLQRYGGKEAF